ncbi:unnamed protein product [Meganyctiphanes norvegica]|uniref:Uncharacterized protein n=1 Tax=Meganyctiphanes norvegica TaxID=48144 RepID=A0AAV2QM07_MEGNR
MRIIRRPNITYCQGLHSSHNTLVHINHGIRQSELVMRLVRRRGVAWKEAAQQAAQQAAQEQHQAKQDKWTDLLHQLKTAKKCGPSTQVADPVPNPPQFKTRVSRAQMKQRAAQEEEEFQGYAARLFLLLAALLMLLVGLAIYKIFKAAVLAPPLGE